MKRYLVYATIAATLVVMALPATAGRQKGGGGTSSIALASDGTARSVGPALGSTVRFTTTVEPLAGWEWPMVAVWCYQDLDGDGVRYFPDDGGDLVYMQLDHPDVEFQLGGGSSQWRDLGGAAECQAILYAYGNRAKNSTIRELARTGFNAQA